MTAIYYFENACAPVPTIMPAYQRVRGSHRRLSKFWSRFVDSFILRRGLAPCEPLPENGPRIITHAEENRARPRLDLRRKLCARAATEDGRRRQRGDPARAARPDGGDDPEWPGPTSERQFEHDPEKWTPVFPRDKRQGRLRGDHAQSKR